VLLTAVVTFGVVVLVDVLAGPAEAPVAAEEKIDA
jgi:hypothetical protein